MSTLPITRLGVDKPKSLDERANLQRWLEWLKPLGSLKLAVASFALAIVLILIGTLAQVNRDIWEVLEVYFRVWWTWVEAPLFFPRSWYPQLPPAQAERWLAMATMGGSLIAAALTWANGQRDGRTTWLGGAVLIGGLAISASTFWLGGFWFPGGAAIGSLTTVNLLTAHLTRYRIEPKGPRFTWGLGITGLGLLITWAVISSGHNAGGFQGEPVFAWKTLWVCVKAGLTIGALSLLGYALYAQPRQRFLRPAATVSGMLLLGLASWLWSSGDATYLGDSGMRVLWQLILALVAGIVLLIGCVLLFRQRAGVVVLHSGIALLMFGQWFVGRYDSEEQMTLAEGQTVNFGQDIRSVELAVIRRGYPDSASDQVTVIPITHNGNATKFLQAGRVSDDRLPFELEIVEYQKSSSVAMDSSGIASPVDGGRNQGFRIVEARPAAGAMSSGVDLASGYFRVLDPKSGKPLGTFLLSQEILAMRGGQTRAFDLETVTLNEQPFDLQLRFVRNFKDYSIRLIDVRKDDYLGTTIPRNYSSQVRLVDPRRKTDQELIIWMNNPRRYAGETFYQSNWQQDEAGREYSTLQVVRNHGWMIPYVACMICVVGMGYHFSQILLRFLDRQSRSDGSTGSVDGADGLSATHRTRGWRSWQWWVIPLSVITVFSLLSLRLATPQRTSAKTIDLERFGQIPLVHQGRVKPFDTLARNALRVISDNETFKGILPADQLAAAWPAVEQELRELYPSLRDQDLTPYQTGDTRGLIDLIVTKSGEDSYGVTREVERRLFTRQPAVRWLLDVITGSDNLRRHKVIRIYHPQVLDLLGLQRRKYYRYSLEEIAPKMDALQQQVMQADEVRRQDVEQLSLYQKKLLETDQKIRTILHLHRAFSPPELPDLPTQAEFETDRTAAMNKLNQLRQAIVQLDESVRALQPPLAVAPLDDPDQPWQAYTAAWPRQVLATRFLAAEAQPSFKALNDILLAYLDQSPERFNQGVDDYLRLLSNKPPHELQAKPSWIGNLVSQRFGSFYQFESFFNQSAPFFYCSFAYLAAFVLLCFGWLAWRKPLNRIAFWLVICTWMVHSLALVARIYISGRPPVTNLYSSAVFIGWGIVALALIIEWFFENGLASLAAAASGFITLLIAYKLAGDGDTFEVLQAVLDTQFWLATHVVCITLGYATTFLAGLLGIVYIVRGVATPSLDRRTGNELARMMYGTLCFAIFFSFVGTILGGLWADDSWGRFWGWDPKENGALIIVLWNALILHARWDRMIRDRGLAVLSVAGNVVTAWSWFGVNELGVGLHSYGFTEGRLWTLSVVVMAHLALIGVGWLPLSCWWSFRRQNDASQTQVT